MSLAQPVPRHPTVDSRAPITPVAAPDARGSASGHKHDPKVPSYLHPGGAVWDPDADEWRCLLCRKAKGTGALKMANASHCAADEHKAAMVWAEGEPAEADEAARDALVFHHPTLRRPGRFL